MELYYKAYCAALKARIKAIDKTPILFGLNYLVVSVIFFFVWSNLILDFPLLVLPFFLLISAGFIIPFVLLYKVLKRNHSKSLLFVIVLMSSTVFSELFDLVYYYDMYLGDPLLIESDICPICEVEDSIQLIASSFMAILLMINQPMAAKFSLSKRSILQAILLPSSVLLLRIALFLVSYFL